MILLYVFVVILLLYNVFSYYRTRRFKELMKAAGHGITTVPVLGIAHHLIGSNESRMKALQYFGLEANKLNGLVAGWLGPLPYVVISDAEVADVVLKKSLDKDRVMKILRVVIGNGLVVAPLSIWRTRRKVLLPTFISKHMKEFVRVFSKQAHVLAELLKKQAGQEPFPIWRYLASNNMDNVCESVFGVQMNIQKTPEHPFLINIDKVSRIMAARLSQPWLHPDTIYNLLPQYQKMKKYRKVLYDIVDEIVEKKLEDLNGAKIENSENRMRSFLELLIESSALEDGPYNKQELREETLTLTIAGTDTSAAAIAFVLQALSKHQDVQEKVYREMKEVFGGSVEHCTMEDLKKLVYMEAAINEGMRLFPPVPVILRRITQDVTLPSGLVLPAGCGVLMNIWALHRNQKYWGEDAEEFRPERFLDTPLKHPAQFMPFSYGPRNCPGSRYAMLSMKTTLATLLNQYRVLPVAGEPRLSFDLMMKDADGYRVQLQLRNNISGIK